MFIDKISRNSTPPPGVATAFLFLMTGETDDLDTVVMHIKSVSKASRRLFCLLYLHEMTAIPPKVRGEIFKEFITEKNPNIRYHMTLFAGMYYITDVIPQLKVYSSDTDELLRCTALWSLAKLNLDSDLSGKIRNELKESEDDRSRALLIAALYLLAKEKNSEEIIFLNSYFLENYFDIERKEYFELAYQHFDLSLMLLNTILLKNDYYYELTANSLETLGITWLLEKNTSS